MMCLALLCCHSNATQCKAQHHCHAENVAGIKANLLLSNVSQATQLHRWERLCTEQRLPAPQPVDMISEDPC